jgi:hypothetical protein
MTKSKLDILPVEVQSNIIYYLSIRDLINLYQTSWHWRRRIADDKFLWRRAYERNFGHEFVKDHWILWALRRLWSQSPLREQRLAARHVNLTSLDHLDAYTWYRLVRGRILTEKN